MLWVEEFRPQTFEDIIGVDLSIINAVKSEDIPHFLFIGSAGTGKTTTARVIIKHLDCDALMLNASDERGINTVREKVKSFAMTKSTNGKLKIVFLDEADALTKDAQTSLRNVMETYHSNCRFIMTCNYVNRIIDPLQSRCQVFKFALPKKYDIMQKLAKISDKKNLTFVDVGDMAIVMHLIVDRNYPDIRRCVMQLQELSNLGREITPEDIKKSELEVEQLFKKLKTEKFSEVRQWILDSNVDYNGLIIEMYRYVMKNKDSFEGLAFTFIKRLAQCNRYLPTVISPDVEFESLLLSMMEDYKNK